MARVFSILCAFACACAALGQATFGRFGYGATAQVPGWSIGKEGFKAIHPLADSFSFPQSARTWEPTETSWVGQTLSLGEAPAGAPSLLREDLYAPGFSMYFPKGIDLTLSSNLAPFLSWPEGTVAQTVPTPVQPWLLVSFRTNQPPVLLVFSDTPTSMVVDGSSGSWHLKSPAEFQGWVRVLLPLGDQGSGPTNAAGLGALSAKVTQSQTLWGPSPKLLELKTESDASSVTGVWTFDHPGALIPVAASLAGFGGYPLKVQSEVVRLGDSAEGPLMLCKTETLRIRFPVKSWPQCRYLSLGPPVEPLSGGSLDVPNAVQSAFSSLSASLDAASRTSTGGSLMSYLSSAKMELEPATAQRLPYDAAGAGYDLAAAHALLTQAIALSNGAPNLPNPLLAAVQAPIDWYTWSPWNAPAEAGRRGAALASIALAMRPEPEQRLVAGILQAGLSSQRGLDLWRRWRGDLTQLPPRLEPLADLRQELFSLGGPAALSHPLELLASPLRVCGGPALTLEDRAGKRMLVWTALTTDASEIELSTPRAIKLGALQNLQSATLEGAGDRRLIRFKPKDVGVCALELVLPPDAPIPASAAWTYHEASS